MKGAPHLFLSTTHACSYLPDQTASTLFIDPRYPVTPELLGDFNRRGFRRSGDLIYRPHCQGCQACVPVRIPVEAFVPSRAQRRTAARNDDVVVSVRPAGFDAEHFALFLRYQDARHPGGAMANPDPATYLRFLVSRHSSTAFHEFRIDGVLAGVAVIDTLPDGLSAVYTFYDPSLGRRGLGTYAIVWQIAETQRRGLPFLYLGYWVKDSEKMAYKAGFRPLEAYRNGRWSPFDLR
ncbi:arginyltransferase [Acidiferrobacter sp. SPIII_3]|uniref:arginyltransferase n=1 Tax=Acidiferrobacter sp. SPIII_3 TaxID=1281578 RepID=UPI000D73FCE1|nr:arginyltransferase [Acidiferrobacter sp. SPIII_3]